MFGEVVGSLGPPGGLRRYILSTHLGAPRGAQDSPRLPRTWPPRRAHIRWKPPKGGANVRLRGCLSPPGEGSAGTGGAFSCPCPLRESPGMAGWPVQPSAGLVLRLFFRQPICRTSNRVLFREEGGGLEPRGEVREDPKHPSGPPPSCPSPSSSLPGEPRLVAPGWRRPSPHVSHAAPEDSRYTFVQRGFRAGRSILERGRLIGQRPAARGCSRGLEGPRLCSPTP